ncbi:putative polysaccharide biosynthesis protein [Cuneatibacter caecimuris]|uniref:Stage V sporulation protein B n=1 Tax=Cuneatibacter caecimuris TaxID=1796618 RepID=A0A4Q7NZZ9_9FIRM|nr:polysaccharide biosynthesis protein [Cuneatibacter caecimuris]RZS92954.1 stage V sporulation protein B [Cuneatibacter caecimuris]
MTAKQKKNKNNQFIIQGSILAAAGIISRLIGMLYRIPMTNIIGDQGNTYYGAAYNIYSLMLLLSSYSMPLAVSKLISSRIARKEYKNVYRLFHCALMIAIVSGLIFSSLTFFLADALATYVLRLPLAALALKALAPTILVMAVLGVLRGFFQGMNTMIPTAFSQLLEQIINAVISVAAAYFLYDIGFKMQAVEEASKNAAAWGAMGGTIGTGAGALLALVFCVCLFMAFRKNLLRAARHDHVSAQESYGRMTKMLIMTIIPVILSTAAYNMLDLVDNSIFGNYMTGVGAAEKYKSIYGVYTGKYLLLIHVPTAFASALSSSVVPSLTRAMSENNRAQMIDRASSGIRMTMLIALPSAVGLTVLAGPIIHLLFPHDQSAAASYLTIGSLSVVFFSLATVTNGILQGINRMRIPVRNAVISLIVHCIVLCGCLWLLHMDIYGVIFSYILFGAVMSTLNCMAIEKYLGFRYEIIKCFLLPLAASALMGGAAWGTYELTHYLVPSNLISVIAAIIIAVLVYAVLLPLLRCVDEADIADLPMGGRLVRLAKKLHLL